MAPVDTAGIRDITPGEFAQFKRLIFDIAGITLTEAKQVLLAGRLFKRVKHFGFGSYSDYYRHVSQPAHQDELQVMVDLLTTNETYFFREAQHFEFLKHCAQQHTGGTFRVWSAAASSGEEAYSIAMVLADTMASGAWEVVGTDISTRVLDKARNGHYSMERTQGIPDRFLKQHCLKGIGEHAGTLLIRRTLRERVRFVHGNLLQPRRDLGSFDVIFLRNVMIYFEMDTKRKVVANLIPFLKPGGRLIVGHSESLNGITDRLAAVQPTIYARGGDRT